MPEKHFLHMASKVRVSQARLDPPHREIGVAMLLSHYPQKGPIAAKRLCKEGEGGVIAIYLGIFGVSRWRGDRTRLDCKCEDSGPLGSRALFKGGGP